jgi:histidinol phosphatase-like enzyme (inositol monophosphatase family)
MRMMTGRKMTDYGAHASHIADIAAQAARDFFRSPLSVEFKADESPVTQADKAIETELRAYLTEQFPDDGIFGEEHGIEGEQSDNLWVIDPIDGTRSFLAGHPLFGFLLGHLVQGEACLGVIGMPALNETFVGIKGEGATLNGEEIHTSSQTKLDQAILFINEGEKLFQDKPELFGRLVKSGQTRRLAYDCYPHALLAAGHVDVVVDYDLQPYDFLPVAAVIEAAGGIMTDWQGRPLTMDSEGAVISSATAELHAQMLELVGN